MRDDFVIIIPEGDAAFPHGVCFAGAVGTFNLEVFATAHGPEQGEEEIFLEFPEELEVCLGGAELFPSLEG